MAADASENIPWPLNLDTVFGGVGPTLLAAALSGAEIEAFTAGVQAAMGDSPSGADADSQALAFLARWRKDEQPAGEVPGRN